ncbi:gamma-aminobutyric acid B receptor [Daphnia sinensis]|uniref:Gamma-aminobutyric acid type B receptor subunit 2 n=1 Tax=Daphnia sinensis TaxID=1820382 RepID=A0AAD5PSB9_9CRUS|nr:gamma-aminobutyric acid B receptor [Daphnia sinensis]
MTSLLQVITTVTMIGFLIWNCAAVAAAAAAGTTSYRIRSRPPAGTTHQSRSSSTGVSRSGGGGGGNGNWQDVYIAGFLALSDHEIEAPLGQGVMPAITLALRHLANSSFLHEYRLRLLYNDTKCSASVGMKAFFDMMDKDPHKVMILGGSCNSVTDSIAKTSKHWRIPVLSYADTHPMFTRKSYPNFFRIVPSENAFNAPRVKLLQAFNWTRVGTLYQNEPRFALAHNGLVSLLDSAGIELTESQGFVNDLTQPLAKLMEKDVRIILASFNATWARRVFCAVSRINLYGGRYQWILAGPRQERWWMSPADDQHDPAVNCTSYEILAALEGAFVVDVLPLTSSKQVTISGLTAEEYEKQYNKERGDSYSQFHGYAYDAVWTAAQTVKTVIHKLHERNRMAKAAAASSSSSSRQRPQLRHWSLRNFTYRDTGWEKLLLDALRSVDFNGVTGRIKFEDNERSGRLTVKQIVGAHEVAVAEYENASDTLFLNESAISWMSESKQPPRDRTIQTVEPSRISVPVFATLTIVAALGIVLASSFLAINIRFRNQRYIKMSSPYLNNMIIIGCLLTYTSVILLGLDSHLTSESALPVICTARIWTLMAGFTLAFGSMFSKTWRVHSIFTDVKLNKKAIKDYQLFMVVGVLLTIDIAILTTWQVIDPFYRETKLLEPYPHPSQDNAEIRPENEYCQSNHMTIFVSSIYAYKGLLMAFGCFLAWETRNVNIPALNDSKYIGMSVYNVVIMCVIGGAVSFILEDEQDVSYVIISIFIVFCTTGTLCLVFVPKLIELRRNPQGTIEKRGVRSTVKPQLPGGKYGAGGGGSGVGRQNKSGANQNRETSLQYKSKTRNAKLRKELRNLDDQIQKLLEQLGEDNDSLAKDGPSFTYSKIDSDCRVPSVSGADTMSLCSLISSPEPTSTSPHHAKENGGKGVRSGHHQELQQQQSVAQSTSSGSGSGSTAPATASVAMWTAISNPLLLISHVLRRSMDLQPTGAANNESMTLECDEASSQRQQPVDADPSKGVGSACCECVSVERHAEPANVHWQNQTIDQAPLMASSSSGGSSSHSRDVVQADELDANGTSSPPMANKDAHDGREEEMGKDEGGTISRLMAQPTTPHQSPPGSFISNLSADRSGLVVGGGSGGGVGGMQSDSPSDEWGAAQVHKSSGSVSVSRCACHHSSASGLGVGGPARRRRCQMMESLSLTEIRSSPITGNGTSLSSEFEPIHNRSLSVQGTMATRSRLSPYSLDCKTGAPYGHQQEHSRSDSSFNYESNMSEVDPANKLVNYFEYRSLESLDSPTISDTTISQRDGEPNDDEDVDDGEDEEEEEANSTRVNFDEGSTFTSPREEDVVVIEDGLYSLPMVVNGDKSPPSDPEQMRLTPPTTPVKTSPVGSPSLPSPNLTSATATCNVALTGTPCRSSSSKGSRGSTGGKSKSQSTRDRRRRAQGNNKLNSNEDLSGRSSKPQASEQRTQQPTAIEHSDWSILPIFKQLIVQRQMETGGGCHSQPIGDISDDDRITTKTKAAIEHVDEDHRQMSSCPNLSIKCDVVEYF